MIYESQYKAKLTDSHGAVEEIGSNSIVAVGQAVCQPPALMGPKEKSKQSSGVNPWNSKLAFVAPNVSNQSLQRRSCASRSREKKAISSFITGFALRTAGKAI